jgi:hypothetical protein
MQIEFITSIQMDNVHAMTIFEKISKFLLIFPLNKIKKRSNLFCKSIHIEQWIMNLNGVFWTVIKSVHININNEQLLDI